MLLESQRHALASTSVPPLHPVAELEGLERRFRRPRWLYPLLVVLICSTAWLLATQIVRMVGFGGFYGVPFALSAVVFAAWLAGVHAGLATAVLSVLMLHLLLPSMRMLDVQEESAWHLVVFSLVAVIMSSFEASVRRQRVRDVREREMRDEFLAIVSHELRTPVTIISGSASLLSRLWERLPAADRSEVLDSLQEESTRLTRMIEDLLLLARIEEGRSPVAEPLLLQSRLEYSVKGFKRLYPRRQIHLVMPENRIVIAAFETYFDAVMRNVIGNAHRFSPPELPIEISAALEGEHAIVRVRDYGPGVSKHLIDEIYEPYIRSQPLADGTRGIGLGLTLCKRAMESMGGTIGARTLDEGGLEVQLTFRLDGESI